MNLSVLDWVLWVGCFLGDAALFSILLYRRRSREFPVFTIRSGLSAAMAVVLYSIYLCATIRLYTWIYYLYDFLDFVLQFLVIWEVARIVMRPTGSWVRDAKRQFILGGAAGVLLAAALAWMLSPPASTLLNRLEARSDLFTALVVCELFVVMLLTAKRLGLGFRNHVFALVVGWSGWVIIVMAVDLLQSYYGTRYNFDALDNVRKFAYLAALIYWIVQFWLEEPARQEISPELRDYILALHNQVKNDLDRVKEQR